MKKIIYYFFRFYVILGLFFNFKRIKAHGMENIPKKGAVLFVSNHQNALLDPLVIITSMKKPLNVLTRAGVFSNKFLEYLFDCFLMLPIYRVRDGWQTLSKNEAIFNRCYKLLSNNQQLLIFAEGNHNLARKVRPLSKGFTRIVFGTFENYPDTALSIIPVGLNYSSIPNFPSKVSIYYGEPINAKDFWDKNDLNKSTNDLKITVRNKIKELTTHIDDPERYDEIIAKLEQQNFDFQDPYKAKELIENIDDFTTESNLEKKKKRNHSLLYYIVILNSIIPWSIWNKLRKGIKQIEFKSTFRYGMILSLFPVFYLLQTFAVFILFGKIIALYYFSFCIVSGLLLTKFSK